MVYKMCVIAVVIGYHKEMFIVLLQLYWLSFLIIGLAAVLLLRQHSAMRRSRFAHYLLAAHPALQAVVLFAVGLVLFLPAVVPGYIFEWPLRTVEAAYWFALIAALGILTVHRRLLVARLLRRPRYDRAAFVFGIIAAASILYDYIISLRVGAPLYGDASVQLAKVTLFQQVHLSLADPYYANHGVVDPRYSTNLLDALQAVAANVLHTTAMQVWKYSYGMYRLLIWLSMFGLLWTYLGKKYRYVVYTAMAILPVLWSGYFLFAELPDRMVLAWVMLFLVGLKLWLETDSWPLLVIASLLIASSHALYALMAFGYLALTLAVLWLTRTVSLRRMRTPLVCLGILALPVALNAYYPSHANGSVALIQAGIINGAQLQLQHYGPFTLARLPIPPLTATLLAALLAGYVWLAQKTRRPALILAAYGTMVAGFVVLLRPGVLALVGYGLLIYQAKQRAARIAVVILCCYYACIIYDPLFWRLAAGSMPLWMVARFQELNVFGIVAAIIGLLFLAQWPLLHWGYRRLSYVVLVIVAALLVWYLPPPQVNDYRITSLQDAANLRDNQQREQRLAALTALRPALQNQMIYSDDANLSINIPAVMHANVQSYNPENESPVANLARRAACAKQLAHTLSLGDLQAAGVTRIVTDWPYTTKLAAMAKTRPYLSLIAQAHGYDVYAVAARPAATAAGVCAIPFGQ